jgi:hypothetical protein
MSKTIRAIYRFLPVQLLILHFRKYQLLLLFWVILILTINGDLASSFGATYLFLAPEYMGRINFLSMAFIGGAMAVFMMAWHITTFIIHSHRMPFLGATRHAFLKYCVNNSLLPLAFFVFYSIVSVRFQVFHEHADAAKMLRLQIGFYIGFLFVVLISFAYFFRVDRNLLKLVLSRITNPAIIREIIPYDSLDYELDIVRADTYISGTLKIKKFSELESYHPRLLHTVLRRHHRNAITATIFAISLLLLSGIFMDNPVLRIPAACGFLVLFSLVMGLVGAMKYFLRSWEIFGWMLLMLIISVFVKLKIIDLRSKAYGLNYNIEEVKKPVYDYEHLSGIFSRQQYEQDKNTEVTRLNTWRSKNGDTSIARPPLVIITVSGGGSRSTYWTFLALQHADSITGGKLFDNTVLITGGSGGMIGAAYWREVQDTYRDGKIKNKYDTRFADNVSKDLLNAIIFSFASVDLISPFNKISLGGYSYAKDRGYAMEQELIRNTEGLLDKKIGDYRDKETSGSIPQMIISSTIVNDGRKLLIGAQPLSYLCRPEYSLNDTTAPPLDAVDFTALFKNQNAYNLRLTSALRMNATFPFVLPVVKLPSSPAINIMDAGLRDNFGLETASRYLFALRGWLQNNVGDIIFLEVRDSKEHEVFPFTEMNSLGKMATDPLMVIQNKWEPIQSYQHGYLKDYLGQCLGNKLHMITLRYMPAEHEKAASLNFHLTAKEKEGITASLFSKQNKSAFDTLASLLQ